MKALRIEHVTVATPDASRALASFRQYFSLAEVPVGPLGTGAAGSGVGAGAAGPGASSGRAAALAVGAARIEFVTPAEGNPLAAVLAAEGEGMAALCLEVANLDAALRALQDAGTRYAIETIAGRRTVQIEPSAAHGVRLALVEAAP